MKIEQIAFQRGYSVSKDGTLKNPKGKVIGSVSSGGYMATMIRVHGEKKRLFTHRLQAFQIHGKELFGDGVVTRHLNGDKTDNSLTNIAIGTQSDNMMDVCKSERLRKATHAASFVKKHDRDAIREYYNKSRSYKSTMQHFGVSSKGALHYILNA